MEHEFVPGKRRCQSCGVKWDYRGDWACKDGDEEKTVFAAPPSWPSPTQCSDSAPEPVKPAQVWHLNVWTNVNGLTRTAMTTAEVPAEMFAEEILTERLAACIGHIIEASTPAEE